MTILLTRPRAQSLSLARRLEGLGYKTFIDPMLLILPEARALFPKKIRGFLVTSQNAIPFLPPAFENPDLPVFAVGEGTASEIRERGYKNIFTALGSVASLEALVLKTLSPSHSEGSLIHFSGDPVRGNLVDNLKHQGYKAERHVVYRAVAAENLSKETLEGLRERKIEAVLFFSPRTAEIFVKLLREASCEVKTLRGICLSQAVAKAAEEGLWKDLVVAEHPTAGAMIDALKKKGIRGNDREKNPEDRRVS